MQHSLRKGGKREVSKDPPRRDASISTQSCSKEIACARSRQASEYAKYYFHLRSMAARLGLFGTEALQPLDVSAAKTVAASGQQFR